MKRVVIVALVVVGCLAILLLGSRLDARAGDSGVQAKAGVGTVRYVSARAPVQGDGLSQELAAERPAVEAPRYTVGASSPLTNPWQLQATLPGAVIKDISFPSQQVGYAAAELGQVWKTTDSGAHWTRILNLGFPYYWYGVQALDPSTVAITGFINNNNSGVLRWSTDGGVTWTPDVTLTSNGWSYRVRFADSMHGLVMDGVDFSAPNRAHYTTNGGHVAGDWTPVVPDPNGGWFGNQFSLLSNLRARASGITYCDSPDVGATWNCHNSVDAVFDGPTFFSDDQNGWVGGGSISPSVEGWVHRTTDGGATWSARTLDGPWPIREIRFISSQLGWAAGGNIYSQVGGMYYSSDGGQTWAVDQDTGAEMDACDSVNTEYGTQIWCAGYYMVNGAFYSVVYTLPPGGGATPTATLTASATATPSPTSIPSSTPTATRIGTPCPPSWQVVPGARGSGADQNNLTAVSASGPNDAWAVGSHNVDGNINLLIEHWDGNAWSIVDAPQFHQSDLMGVASLSPTDAWAVGGYDDFTSGPPLVLHWDGTQWTQVPCPNPGQEASLQGIAAVSADDIWAVGVYQNLPDFGTLIEHWDGGAWTVVPNPPGSTPESSLRAVSALSANDVWAVGYGSVNGHTTLVEHWDGTQWSIFASPNPGTDNYLNGVAAISANDVWAVGSDDVGAISLHWDGADWTAVAVPALVSSSLFAVTAFESDNVYAVGSHGNFPGQHTLILHWDGVSWTQVYSPNVDPGLARLEGAAFDSGGNAWVVGQYGTSNQHTLAERYQLDVCCQFGLTDVHSTDYFYEAVRYLVCHRAISGYSDGTFRPYNNTTRGQLTKIVVLAEGWTINTTGGPHFSDVPVTNPFYPYIETAYNRGIISGYADGTFRWGNDVTRAQLCKIIVLAQDWPIDTTGGPHFSDVPLTDPFYGYIETAYNRGIISGYAGGTFRPGNNATRGQISKIVYLAVVAP